MCAHTQYMHIHRDLTLKLRPSRQVFASGVRFEVGGAESAKYDPSTFYQGKVVGKSILYTS